MTAPNRPAAETPTEAAARWFLTDQEGRLDPAGLARREAWLAENSAHREAFDQVAEGWDAVGAVCASPEMIARRRQALTNAEAAKRARIQRTRIWRIGGVAAACLLAAAMLGVGYRAAFGPERTSTYATAAGERRTITLEDQSQVSLDQASRIEVRYTGRARSLKLLAGQAEFRVAHDARRPFAVTARDRTVVATGTVFNVDLIDTGLVVTLIEGRVLVADAAAWAKGQSGGGTARPVELRPDDQLTVMIGRTLLLRSRTDAAAAVAWKLGKLVFENEPLSAALDRMNRYASRKVSLLDPALASTPVSGVFDAGDTRAFVEALTAELNVRSVQGPDGGLLLYRRK